MKKKLSFRESSYPIRIVVTSLVVSLAFLLCPSPSFSRSGFDWKWIELEARRAGLGLYTRVVQVKSGIISDHIEQYEFRHHTVAHRALELESKLHNVNPSYEILNRIIDEAKNRISMDPPYSRKTAIKILQSIDDLLVENNFLYKNGVNLISLTLQPRKLDGDTIQYLQELLPERYRKWNHPSEQSGRLLPSDKQKEHALSHLGEKYHFADCDELTLLYLAIGEILDLPISKVYVPYHSFIRWRFSDGSYLNWETTVAEARTDEDYISLLDIPSSAIDTGAFLRSLGSNEILEGTYLGRGISWADRMELDKAIADFNKAIATIPNHDLAYYNRGKAYLDKGDFDRAITDFDRAISIYPSFCEAYCNRGLAHKNMGSYKLAISDCNKAIELNPREVSAYVTRGNTYNELGDYDRAIMDYTKTIAMMPNHTKAICNRGGAYAKKGDHDRAVKDFDKVITIDPTMAEAYINRGNLYILTGNPDLAITDCTKGISLNANSSLAYFNRGLAYCHIRDDTHAIADFDKAIAIDPKMTEAYINRGASYCRKEDDDRAITDFNKAIHLDPSNSRAYKNRAISLFYKRKYTRAWADVKRCRQLGGTPNPQFVELLRQHSRDK